MHVDIPLADDTEAHINGDCDCVDGFALVVDGQVGSLKLTLNDEQIEKLIEIFREWGYLRKEPS